jgi:hypothetical protein
MGGTGGGKAFLVDLPVTRPKFAFFDIRQADFPTLVRIVYSGQKPPPLLFPGKVKKNLYDAGAVDVKMALHIHNRSIAIAPKLLPAKVCVGKLFCAPYFRMNAHNQNVLIIGTIENADFSPTRKAARRAPQKIMLSFFGACCLKLKT